MDFSIGATDPTPGQFWGVREGETVTLTQSDGSQLKALVEEVNRDCDRKTGIVTRTVTLRPLSVGPVSAL